ncbi:alpha-crystallin domain-containing protein 22.3-like [Bidens hawaiensis]|uniref:alpha-crystallin domain-containing protein 22.3-like n=1 Tax=Bidens hawaiensis TaxID=980011 RepID=UPI00404A40B3
MASPNASNMDWADQAPIAVAPLNSVPYTGPPFDSAEQNQPLNHPTMVFLDDSTTMDDVNQILSISRKGLAVEGAAAGDLLKPLVGAYDVYDNDDGFFFRVALPGVEKNEKFKCAVLEDGTVEIEGASSTGGKTVHSHNMVFEMHTQNLCPPGDLTVSFKLGAHVDPATLEQALDNGVLEGVVKKKSA